MTKRAIVYVDGFNFYYGVYVRNPQSEKLKWLDLVRFSELLLKDFQVIKVKHFTARVSALGDDRRPIRQQTWWRALKQVNGERIEIIEGKFRTDPRHMPIAYHANGAKDNQPIRQSIWVIRTEEKGSDVNLATHLVFDACSNKYDTALVISNDSDLTEAVRIVKFELGKEVILANPYSLKGRMLVKELQEIAPNIRTIRYGQLQVSQLPDIIPGTSIHKPTEWC